jgi:hypothetical protein
MLGIAATVLERHADSTNRADPHASWLPLLPVRDVRVKLRTGVLSQAAGR